MLFLIGKTLSSNSNINEYVEGKKKVPIKTYFIDCSEICSTLHEIFPQGSKICENLFFLGKSGVKIIEDLQVAFISGTKNEKYEE